MSDQLTNGDFEEEVRWANVEHVRRADMALTVAAWSAVLVAWQVPQPGRHGNQPGTRQG